MTKVGVRNIIDVFKVQATTPTVAHCIATKAIDDEYRGYKVSRVLVLNCRLVS